MAKGTYAIIMDNSAVPGMASGNAHRWERTNILYSDNHVRGSLNKPDCYINPNDGSVRNWFTHDNTPLAMTQVWWNADEEGKK